MTLSSMTGFARTAGTHEEWTWSWELKSVNAKGLDVRTRLPMGFDGLEVATRGNLSKMFKRGSITAALTLQQSGGATRYQINRQHLDALIIEGKKIARENPDFTPVTTDGLLSLRGVIEVEDDDAADQEPASLEKLLIESLNEAVVTLADTRVEEGARLAVVLTEFIDTLASLLDQVAKSAELQPDIIRERLKAQIADIVSDFDTLDPTRLEQEAAIIMTKADIREELDRFAAHIASVREMMAEGGAIGRRLDFLCQELNREANTICSKAHDTSVTRIGLDMKATVEQFREQVQNIE
ncbi:YicC family protein [Rhodospirillales bacterium]|nr:YicC family protein [Rhodospirillales bacterium]